MISLTFSGLSRAAAGACSRSRGDAFSFLSHADHQSARPAEPPGCDQEGEGARAAIQSAEARRVHAGVHDDSEEAQLRVAESRACAPDEWLRGDGLHSRGRPQPAGTLDRADPWWTREGSAWRPVSHRPREPRRVRRHWSEPEPLQVRHQEAARWWRRWRGGWREEAVSRRKKSVKRPILPDARYDSQTVSKFINAMMLQGKKSTDRKSTRLNSSH